MLQLSFEFSNEPPQPAEVQLPTDGVDELDQAYNRATRWSKRLATRLGERVRLVITDNRSTMLSARAKAGRLEVRLHHMFLTANEDILEAVGDYLTGDQAAAPTLDRFIEEQRPRLVAPSRPQAALRTQGRHHDLRALLDDLAERHFGGPLEVTITWGRRVRPKRRQRTLRLGTYVPEDRLIRIHPVLDQAWVPRFFIESVVFHEMLHHELPAVVRNGRRHYHTSTFKQRERSFEYYALSRRWEQDNLWRLLRGQ